MWQRLALAALMALGALTWWHLDAWAHERRQLGPYILVVGFLHEPAYVEERNGAAITVFRTDGRPVEGLEKTLKVEVSAGGASRTFDLTPDRNNPGTYVAEFIPTRLGTYVFRFFGTIENLTVDERFESGPGRFDEVVSKATLQFPTTVPSNGELAAQLQRAPAQGTPAPALAAGGTEAHRALREAERARTRATVLGIAGLAVGLGGLMLALYALWTCRASPSGKPPSTGQREPV
jgi:hypothetical protein